MLLAHGDQGGGYAVYVDAGHVHVVHNGGHGQLARLDGGPLTRGADRQIVLRIDAPGQWRWRVSLDVDGNERGRLDDVPMPFPMAPFEGIDVGIDRRSPVDWQLYEREGPFPFTGRLQWVRYEPGERAPDAPARFLSMLKEIGARFE
jgi:arylsulfatase